MGLGSKRLGSTAAVLVWQEPCPVGLMWSMGGCGKRSENTMTHVVQVW